MTASAAFAEFRSVCSVIPARPFGGRRGRHGELDLDFCPADVTIGWLADALARLPRWLGRAEDARGNPLTVAQHSVWCAETLAAIDPGQSPGQARAATLMAALLHDGHEAWTGDIPYHVRRLLRNDEAVRLEESFDEDIRKAAAEEASWDADWIADADSDAVQAVDALAAVVEAHSLLGGGPAAGKIAESSADRLRRVTAALEPPLRRSLRRRITQGGIRNVWQRDLAAERFRRAFAGIAALRSQRNSPPCPKVWIRAARS